ncbi:hypothetical protein RB195_014155 [Necator americanus]|uniref:Uncharacterized protein n=1 Tax=Necator americanus TaxID=51031 RepID=A0ABR1DYU0_NECAM
MEKDEAPKHFPKPKMYPKKTMVTEWWCAAEGVIHCNFTSLHEICEIIHAEKYCKEVDEMLRNSSLFASH